MKRVITLAILIGLVGAASAATIGHWDFAEGADGAGATGQHNGGWDDWYQDSSGNANHLNTWPNPAAYPTYVDTGAGSLALDFDGGDRISTHSGDGGSPVKMIDTYSFSSGFTIEATFKLDVVNAWQGIVSKDGKTNPGNPMVPFQMKMDPGGVLNVAFMDINGVPFGVNVPAGYVEVDKWTTISATYDNSTFNVYGQKEDAALSLIGSVATHGNAADLGQAPRTDYPAHDPGWNYDHGWTVGYVMWDGIDGVGNHMDGQVNEVKISDSVLGTGDFIGVIPEPATLSLFGLIGGGMLWIRKRFTI